MLFLFRAVCVCSQQIYINIQNNMYVYNGKSRRQKNTRKHKLVHLNNKWRGSSCCYQRMSFSNLIFQQQHKISILKTIFAKLVFFKHNHKTLFTLKKMSNACVVLMYLSIIHNNDCIFRRMTLCVFACDHLYGVIYT